MKSFNYLQPHIVKKKKISTILQAKKNVVVKKELREISREFDLIAFGADSISPMGTIKRRSRSFLQSSREKISGNFITESQFRKIMCNIVPNLEEDDVRLKFVFLVRKNFFIDFFFN
jgi:hypothetical protein